MKQQKIWWQPLVVLAVLVVFFTVIYYGDNKYQTPPPYGRSGVITLNGEDLEQENPVFLIDGWLLSDERITDKPTYIGEFSSLQRGELSVLPHGEARYQLTLRYDGDSKNVSVDFPELYSQYVVFLDGEQCARGMGNGRITFLLTPGDHVLTVETSSKAGYYSGMYFPPALGTDQTIQRMENIQSFAYALAFLLPLHWRRSRCFCGGREEPSAAGLDGCAAVMPCICFGISYFFFLCPWRSTGSWCRIWHSIVCAFVWCSLRFWLPVHWAGGGA